MKVEPPAAVATVPTTPVPAPPNVEAPAPPIVLTKLSEPKLPEVRLPEVKLPEPKLPEVKLPENTLPEIAPRPLAVPTVIAPPTEAVLLKPVFVTELSSPTPKPAFGIVEPTPVPTPAPVVVKLPEVKLPEVTPFTTAPTPITVAAPVIPDAGPFPGIKPLSSIPTLRPSNAESPIVVAKLETRPLPTPPRVDLPSVTTPLVIKAPQVKIPEFPPAATPPPPVVAPPAPPSINPEPVIETVVLKPAPVIARAQPPTPLPTIDPPAISPPVIVPPSPPEPRRIGTTADTGAVSPPRLSTGKEVIPAPLESSLLKLTQAKTEEVKANPNPVPEPANVVPVPSATVTPPKPAEELPADGVKPRAWYQRLFAKNNRATGKPPGSEDSTATATPAVTPDGPPAAPARRIVTREGLVSSWVSGQAPGSFALEDPRTGKVIGFLASTNSSLAIKMLSGRRVIVTGEEATDSRWPTAPILTVETLKTID